MLRGVERRHLDRRHRLQPLRDGVAHDAVHVAFMDQRAGMAVVGAQDEVARIDALLRHRLDLGSPRRTRPSPAAASPSCPGARGRWRPRRACPRGRPPGRRRHSRGRAGRDRARRSGRRPSCRPSRVAAISPAITGSLATTPGKFITSPSPMMFGQVIASATSSTVELGAGILQPGRRRHAGRHLRHAR